jgi:hypothetical protein
MDFRLPRGCLPLYSNPTDVTSQKAHPRSLLPAVSEYLNLPQSNISLPKYLEADENNLAYNDSMRANTQTGMVEPKVPL